MAPAMQCATSTAAATTTVVTTETVCANLATRFRVRPTEVALLRLEAEALRFCLPCELTHIGSIPLNSTAVAARTARTQRAELFNNFAGTIHWSIFETVRLQEERTKDPLPIQKLMSAPVIADSGAVLGVLQISRKGATPQEAGPDFGSDDLLRLKLAAAEIAPAMLQLAMPGRNPGQKLCFEQASCGATPAPVRKAVASVAS